jgi:hypothetical protein
MAASLGPNQLSCQLTKSSARAAVTRGSECGKVKNLGRSRYQETTSGDCNILRPLVCVSDL